MEDDEQDYMNRFEQRLRLWMLGSQNIIDKHTSENFPILFNGDRRRELDISRGRRYIRVFTYCPKNKRSQQLVFAFIDKTNGDILKAASWKQPAKTARGNIFNSDDGLDCVVSYGIKYLKD